MRATTTKALATVAFVFIIAALAVIATTPPASGYEISVYEAYPAYFWFFIIASIACGLSILVFSAFGDGKHSSGLWTFGLFAIIVSNIIILMLPVFRDYAFYGRGDPLGHVGLTRDILLYGHIGEENFYPIIHILAASISYVTGLSLRWMPEIIPPFFSILYILSIYLLSTVVSKNRGQALLITTFGSLMVFGFGHFWLAPSQLCYFITPLILFLYYKTRSPSSTVSNMVLFILFLFLTPFLHPLESVFLILVFLCFNASVPIYRVLNRHQALSLEEAPSPHRFSAMNPPIIVFITLFTWFSTFSIFGSSAKTVANSLFYNIGTTDLMRLTAKLETAHFSTLQFIDLLLKKDGQPLIYIILAIVISVLLLRKMHSSRNRIEMNQIAFMVIFAVFGVISVVFLVRELIVGYDRVLRYSILAATILNGLGLYILGHGDMRADRKPLLTRIMPFMVTIILVASSIFCLFNCYFSPITRGGNHQITRMELDGVSWFLDYSDEEIYTEGICFPQWELTHAMKGFIAANEMRNVRYSGRWLPAHFGYTENRMLGQSYQEDRYLGITKMGREYLSKVYPEYSDQWSYNDNDFESLEHDLSVSRIYTNGEVDVFYVKSQPLQ